MKLHELIENRIIKKIPIIYKIVELENEKKVMGMVDLRNNKTYVIDASLKDFEKFKDWEGIKTDVDLQKTKTISIGMDGKKLQNMRIKTQFGDNNETGEDL